MRRITQIALFSVLTFSTFLFLNFYKYYDSIGIDGYHEGFIINEWDKSYSKKDINKLFIDLSNKYKLKFIRVNEGYY